MKIVMVAGGTGGHIYPALTLAKALEERGHKVSFIGSNDRMEKRVIPAAGYEYTGIDVLTTRGSLIQKAKSLISIGTGYLKCLGLLKGQDMVIGFGNYISVPVVLAGKKLGLKTVLHEQNSFVGRANRMLDEKVDLIIGSYEEDKKQFKNPHTLILGNPQSSRAVGIAKDPAVLKEMGLDPDRKTVVIFMGSLGSESVNKVLMEYFTLLDGSYQVIYATGTGNYEEVRNKVKETEYLKIFERIDGIQVMANSTLLVSRAGATTLAEVTAMGMPSILIPSPYVPNNHQFYNGKALTDKNAAVMIEEKDLTAEKLKGLIEEIINDDERLTALRTNSCSMGNNSVLEDIIKEIEKL